MTQLEVLILGETKKIYDYSCLGKLKNLKVFGICHYQTNISGTKLKMKSNEFVNKMPNLEWVDLVDCKIDNWNFAMYKYKLGFVFLILIVVKGKFVVRIYTIKSYKTMTVSQ